METAERARWGASFRRDACDYRYKLPALKLDDARAAELAKGRGCLIYTCKSNPSTLIVKGIQSVFDSTDVN